MPKSLLPEIVAEREHNLDREREEACAAPATTFVGIYLADHMAAHRRCIYALLDPRVPEIVMYVGMTTGHPLVRLEGHLREAEPRLDRRGDKLPVPRRTTWIRSLKDAGVSPMLAVLEVVPEGESLEDSEQKWIRFYLLRGQAAMNGQMRLARFYGMKR